MSTETTVTTEIKIGEKGRKQLGELIEAIERTQQQANTYIAGLMAGLDVPEGWQFDQRRMAFVAPEPAVPAPEPEPEPAPEEAPDAAE